MFVYDSISMFLHWIFSLFHKEKIDVKIESSEEDQNMTILYLDVDASIISIRHTCNLAEIKLHEIQINQSDLDDSMEKYSVTTFPALICQNGTICQPNTILRYVSKLAHTYSSDSFNAAIIDQWAEVHNDYLNTLKNDQDEEQHLNLVHKDLMEHRWLGNMDRISMADIVWYPTIQSLSYSNKFEKYPQFAQWLDSVLQNDEEYDSEVETCETDEDEDIHNKED